MPQVKDPVSSVAFHLNMAVGNFSLFRKYSEHPTENEKWKEN